VIQLTVAPAVAIYISRVEQLRAVTATQGA
jgi:hypothetical protein